MIDVIAEHYGISHRFHAILKSSPPLKPGNEQPPPAAQPGTTTAEVLSGNDLEHANGTTEKPPVMHVGDPEDINHYAIAKHLINYQSLDLGEKCMPSEAEYHCHRC
jgi:hypothetical protein